MWKHSLTLLLVTLIQIIPISKEENLTCAENEFTCKDGQCIMAKWRCDAEADCIDLSDEEDCTSYPICSSNEFQCNQSKLCITDAWKCDGDYDCADKSDESSCDHGPCTDEEYRCSNGQCIKRSYVCDGDPDCQDSSDEDCDGIIRCRGNTFLCDSVLCIDVSWRCDGDNDCLDRKDEANCTHRPCAPQQWQCNNGQCIPEGHRCDRDPDCRDGSDEIGCSCDDKALFQCRSGQCIKSESVCNGELDCIDGTDEYNCSHNGSGCTSGNCTVTVPDNSSTCPFRCWNNQCIEIHKVCDRKKDCEDGHDESKCPTWKNQTLCGMNRGGCQHVCTDYEGSLRCSCYEGFEIVKTNPKRCEDINECKIFGFCSHLCINTHGSYNCSCHTGYVLDSGGRRCKALGPRPLLLFGSVGVINVAALKSPRKILARVQGIVNAVAVDYWLEGNLMFWTDTVLRTIKSANLNGTMIKDVIKFGLERPCGLAVDWMGRKLFWVDSETGRIELSNFDGTQRKAIFWQPIGRLRAIALDPKEGYIFWTEWDEEENYTKSSIARANMDGTDMRRILYKDVYWPNALVVDHITKRIFFADAKDGLISSTTFDGEEIRVIMNNNFIQPFSISTFEDELYVTSPANKAIFKMNKFGETGLSLVRSNIKSPTGIATVHKSRQPRGSYSCGDDNGGCSHICLPTSSAPSCVCPTGFKLLNSTHCSEKIDKFVAYLGDYVVRQVSLDTDDMLDVVLPFENVLDVIAMDWDPITDEMYWADIYNNEITIRKGKMSPPYFETAVNKIPGKVSTIGIDWLTRKLYWSEEERDQILVSNLDGSSTTVLIWKKCFKPRNLLLHVEKRYLYWTSHDDVVSINRAGMDGSTRERITSDGLVNPTDLTLDKVKHNLYWVDGGDIIHYISLETKKRNSFKVSYYSKTLRPFSIGVYEDQFFWADSNLKKVFVMNLGEKKEAKIIGKFSDNPVRLAVFQQVPQQGIHPCVDNNGDCSDLCVLSPSQDFRCLCPAGRRLKADNKTCGNASEISRFVLVNSDGRLLQVPLSVSYKTDIMIPSEGNKDILAFDVDVMHRFVYFIKKTLNKKEICAVALSGGKHKCIFSDMLRAPGDIAYDPVRHYVYWTDFLTKKIYLADRKGEFWTVIVSKDLDLPLSITVAYKHGLIFWTDLGKQISISRANTDGSSQTKIVTTGIAWPNSLTVDHVSRHLYWTDYHQQRIELCDFSGKHRRQFISTLGGATSISLFSRFLYWSEWHSNVLKKSEKTHAGLSATVVKGLNRVIGIQAVNLRKIPVSNSDCEHNNGNCSHFCLRSSAGISCACPVGIKLDENGKTCSESPKRSIFYSTGKTIRRISLDTDDLTSFMLPTKYFNKTKIASFVVTKNNIIWTDGTKIYSSFKNGSDSKTVVTGTASSIKSLSVDWISKNIFWTDFLHGNIKITNFNGSFSANLISDELESPHDIVVNPIKGLLFWTDAGRSVIEKSYTNGKSRIVIAHRDIYQPVGLATDSVTEFLYWADWIHHTVERCNYDGQGRITIIKRDAYATGLAILGSHVYWTDNRQYTLLRADKETGAQLDILEENLEIPMSVAAFSRNVKPEASPCFNNGNCKHLCLSTPNGRSCASVCKGELYLNESCDSQENVAQPTSSKPSVRTKFFNVDNECDKKVEAKMPCIPENENGNCTDGLVKNLTKEKKTRHKMKIAYIVGGIVFVAFVIAMFVLAFLCHRRLKTTLSERKKNQLMQLRVTFEKRRTASKEDPVNDSLVTISSKYHDQMSTTSSPCSVEKFPVSHAWHNKEETEEANQRLTISSV